VEVLNREVIITAYNIINIIFVDNNYKNYVIIINVIEDYHQLKLLHELYMPRTQPVSVTGLYNIYLVHMVLHMARSIGHGLYLQAVV
jgi:hypothetical protein